MTKITNFKEYLMLILKGIGVGIAMLIPGVSGGTLALMLGIYDDIIESVAGLRKHFKDSVIFLIPIAIGGVIGYIIALFTFKYGLKYIPIPTLSLFVGLIIGGIPSIFKNVKGTKPTLSHIVCFALSFLFVIGIAILSIVLNFDISIDNIKGWEYILILVGGIISAFALVVPGISGSAILLILGLHSLIVQTSIPNVFLFDEMFGKYLIIDVLFAIGAVIGLLTISKLMRYLLSQKTTHTFYSILGFIVASIFAIYYNNDVLTSGYYDILMQNPYQFALIVVLLIVGIVISLLMERHTKKNKEA